MYPSGPSSSRLPAPAISVALTAALYLWLWPYSTGDIAQSYVPWLLHIVDQGPVQAFGAPFGDYSPPYLYALALAAPFEGLVDATSLVKLVAVGSTLALAMAVRRLLIALGVVQADRIAALVPLMPSVALNAVLMGSCDALWAAPCVMAVACAVERRHAAMLAWCGVALAVKAQALFGAPFFLALLIARGVPFRLWPITPLVVAALFLPAWAAGWPAGNLATIYFRQAGFFEEMSRNAPNLWAIVQSLPGASGVALTGLANAAAVGAAVLYTAHFSAARLSARALVAAATLAPLVVVGLLPRMHERYFFLADILVLAHATAIGGRRAWGDAALVQAGSALGILAYCSGVAGFAALGAVAMLAATWRIARPLHLRAGNDNSLPLRVPAG